MGIISKKKVILTEPSLNGDGHSHDEGYVIHEPMPDNRLAQAREYVNAVIADPRSEFVKAIGKTLDPVIAKHANDPTTIKHAPPQKASESKPAPDFDADTRTTAKLLFFLQHDTPERTALLKAAGIEPEELSPKHLALNAECMLEVADENHKSEEFMWAKHRGIIGEPVKAVVGLNTRRLSQVHEEEVEWIWPQRIPVGKLTLISGDPDLGKTWAILDIIARITTGRDFPDSPNPFTATSSYSSRRDALWVSAEDEDEDTVKPRFGMLGGDANRLHSLAFVRDEKRNEHSLNLSTHLDYLDVWLKENKQVAIVALDPLAAFLGKIDTHRNSDVRGLLTPLAKLAAKHRVAIIGNNHLHKADSDNAMYKGMGSIAFVAAARSSWLVTADPEQPKDRRLFTKVKGNLASQDVGGLAFRVGPAHQGFYWEKGTVEVTANEALQTAAPGTRTPAITEAKEWLADLLKDGPVKASAALEKAKADMIHETSLKRARKQLGVVSRNESDGFVWSLPDNGKG